MGVGIGVGVGAVATTIPWGTVGMWAGIITVIIILIVIASKQQWVDKFINTINSYPSRANNDARAMDALTTIAPLVDIVENNRQDYKSVLRDIPADEQALSNFYVLGCRLTGYIGPQEMNGIFATKEATLLALRAGARVLVLDIDYLEKEKTIPRLVCRNRAGYLLSNNTGAISDVADAIAEFKARSFSPSDPIIVVLNVLRLPGETKSAESLTFMENIARGLGSIMPHVLRQTPKGTYYGRRMEDVLFRQKITDFDNKVIILTNADTTGFRSPPQTYTVNVKANLDNLVHARIYSNKSGEVETGIIVGARMDTPIFYTDLPDDRRKTYSDAAMKEFTIAMTDDAMPELPTTGRLDALRQLGVQCIPVNIFAACAAATTAPIYSEKYFKSTSYIVKDATLRYKEDKVITVAAPSPSQNTNGGRIQL
jgi:hypothetical protein